LLPLRALILLCCGPAVFAGEPRAAPPAEEVRLNPVQFREWLKTRGLTELLDLHLRDFPPADPTTTLLLMREVKLAQFADRARSLEDRRSAVAEANRILEQLVADNAADPRRPTWQYTLAYSLIYDEAEPYATNMLYFGGSGEDRGRLAALTARALEAVRSLTHFITDEFARIDRLSAEAFEEVERRGYLEELDRLGPSADYLLLWILFYDALARNEGDAVRAGQLREIMDTLAVKPAFLQTPHEKSRIQVQAVLLAGMTQRRLNDHAQARDLLDRARAIAERITDATERARVRWAATLAAVEAVHNERDDGRLDDALADVARLRDLAGTQGDPFALRFAAGLMERSIHRARAAVHEKAGRMAEVKSAREQAWMSLARLVADHPDRKNDVYSATYGRIDAGAPIQELDPFEQCALMTGLIRQAEQQPEAAPELLDRAITVGNYWLAHPTDNTNLLAAEVLFELGVAQHRRGDQPAAVRRLLEATTQYSRSAVALPAATLAVRLAWQLHTEQRGQPEMEALYKEAVQALLVHHGETETGRYWRFFYAQLLDEAGDYAAAGREYAKVHESHEHYLESGFLGVRTAFAALQRSAADADVDPAALSVGADKSLTAYRDFAARAARMDAAVGSAERSAVGRRLLAEARLLTAEAMILEGVDRAGHAIELLSDFEKSFAEDAPLTSRVWRIRLLAYEALGRLDEAAGALPQYVKADPANAGVTLQSLYQAISGESAAAAHEGANREAQSSAELALLLAEQLMVWAQTNDPSVIGMDRRALQVQLGEAHLRMGNAPKAQELFDTVAAAKATAEEGNATDILTSFGQAEAHFQQGRFSDALPKFNRLATTLPPEHPVRWKSLLRDLQCRTRLGEPPTGILKVVEQQRFLFSDLGGPVLADEFDRLRRENERRRDEQK
jgi:tetratricopeptide (TPR) repeat protein